MLRIQCRTSIGFAIGLEPSERRVCIVNTVRQYFLLDKRSHFLKGVFELVFRNSLKRMMIAVGELWAKVGDGMKR
jgi:hypothetical protein